MCCLTKRKIADCVKGLVCRKGIRKITVQDIMNGTNMSRQSFYYHFQNIYDVLEWIGIHDFVEPGESSGSGTVEEWILQCVSKLQADPIFYRRLVEEIHWPVLLERIRMPIEDKVAQIFRQLDQDDGYSRYCGEEWRLGVGFFTTTYSYYLMDYVYRRRALSDGQVLKELAPAIAVLAGCRLQTGPYMVLQAGLAG